MSWDKFDVFYSGEDNISKIKQCAFIYNHINIYISQLCSWVQEENYSYNELAKWLINNDILRIVDSETELEYNLRDKTFYSANRELLELVYKNKKRLANPPKYSKEYEEKLNEADKKDENDPFIEEILLRRHRKIFDDELLSNETIRYTLTAPHIPKNLKDELRKKFDELYQLKLNHFKTHVLKNSHSHRNKYILDQFCSSYSTYIESYEKEYYEYKLSGYRNYDAIKFIRAAEIILPLVNHTLIDEFSFKDILEIRKKRHWKKGMKQLSDIVTKIPFSEDTSEFENQVNVDIRELLFDVMESQRDSPIKGTMKSLTSLGINFLPIYGQIAGAGKAVADPLIDYLKENTKQKSLAYFILDLRKVTKK
jgi:hypothetical protein